MPEAPKLQTLEAILPRLVSDDRFRSALAEWFGPRADDVRRRVEAGEPLPDEDRITLIEGAEEVLKEDGDVVLTLPPEADEDEFYGEDNMTVWIRTSMGFFWIDAPEFDPHDAYFDSLEGAVKYAEDMYGHMLGANGDE